MEKDEHLETLYRMDNKLELTIGSFVDGERVFSKWVKYSDLKEKGIDLNDYNLRTICLNEIVIEFDNKDQKLAGKKAKEWIFEISKKLEKEGINHTIWDYENSVSPHLHIYGIADLETIDRKEAPKLKQCIAEYFCTEEQKFYLDTTKFGLRNLIAIEDTPHWKHGTMKKIVYIYLCGNKNNKLGYFFNLVNELHSNMSNRSNKINLTIKPKLTNHLTKIKTLKQELQEINGKQFDCIEPEEVRQRDLEWYKSTDFNKGGLTYKPKEKYPYTFLHRGVNVIRFYKKVKEEEIGNSIYAIYEVKAYFMFYLNYQQYGYLAIPKSLDDRLFNHVVKISLQNPQIKDLFGLTFIINKFGNSRFPTYEFEILNQVYTEEFVQELEKLKKEILFDLAPLLVPKFKLLRLMREKNNTYKAKTWLNKMEAIIRGELKITEHIDMVNLTRELLRINVPEKEIHRMCQINYEQEYSFKECQEQIDSIKKYLTKQKENNNNFLEKWAKQIADLHYNSGK